MTLGTFVVSRRLSLSEVLLRRHEQSQQSSNDDNEDIVFRQVAAIPYASTESAEI